MREKIPVLVVERDFDLRNSLVEMFNDEGYEATGVADGPEALIFLIDKKVALIVIDLGLSAKDGFKLIEEIKKNVQLGRVLIFLITDFLNDFVIGHAAKLGVQCFSKPFDLEDFLNLTRQAVG